MKRESITDRPARHARLVATYRAGIAAQATRETPQNRVKRRLEIRAGDRALVELLDDLDGLFRYLAKNHAQNAEDLKDLLQVARLHAVQALGTWRSGAGSSVSTWVTSFLRKKLRAEGDRMRPQREVLSEFSPGSGAAARAGTALPEHQQTLDHSATATAIRRFRDRLDAQDRDILDELIGGRVNAGGSMGSRARIRAVVAHPASGALLAGINEEPRSRPLSPVDVDADVEALRAGRYPQEGWQALAACRDSDWRAYFPSKGEAYPSEILQLCRNCPVRLDCLAAGIEASTWPGLWGGHASRTRRGIRLRVRNGAAAAPTHEYDNA